MFFKITKRDWNICDSSRKTSLGSSVCLFITYDANMTGNPVKLYSFLLVLLVSTPIVYISSLDELCTCYQPCSMYNYTGLISCEEVVHAGMPVVRRVAQPSIEGRNTERHLLGYDVTNSLVDVRRFSRLDLIYARTMGSSSISRRSSFRWACSSALLGYGRTRCEVLCTFVIFKHTVARRSEMSQPLTWRSAKACYLLCAYDISNDMLVYLEFCHIFWSNDIICVNLMVFDGLTNDYVCTFKIHYYAVQYTYACPVSILYLYDV